MTQTVKNFLIPPEDPIIKALPTHSDSPITQKFLDYVHKHGFTTVTDVTRKIGDLSAWQVRMRADKFNLRRRYIGNSQQYWHNLGYTYGNIGDLSSETLRWVSLHVVGTESFAQTLDRILRGDTKPHPRCRCSFCLRSRE